MEGHAHTLQLLGREKLKLAAEKLHEHGPLPINTLRRTVDRARMKCLPRPPELCTTPCNAKLCHFISEAEFLLHYLDGLRQGQEDCCIVMGVRPHHILFVGDGERQGFFEEIQFRFFSFEERARENRAALYGTLSKAIKKANVVRPPAKAHAVSTEPYSSQLKPEHGADTILILNPTTRALVDQAFWVRWLRPRLSLTVLSLPSKAGVTKYFPGALLSQPYGKPAHTDVGIVVDETTAGAGLVEYDHRCHQERMMYHNVVTRATVFRRPQGVHPDWHPTLRGSEDTKNLAKIDGCYDCTRYLLVLERLETRLGIPMSELHRRVMSL